MDVEYPLRVNLVKFLAEERRKCILDFAKEKISANPGQEMDWKILQHMIGKQTSIVSEVIDIGNGKEIV